MKQLKFVSIYVFVSVLFLFAIAVSAQNLDDVEIKSIKAAENVFMLEGRGGNIGLSVGDDGAFLIDDQFAPLTDKITAAVDELTEQPIQFVINTHWHRDHVGGNENLGKAGVIIVAHENVRKRMSTEQFIEAFGSSVPPSPKVALPVITFTEDLTFHWNDDEIHVFHVEDAHTDGDSIIHFRKANVIHAGDTFFNGMYPFIDVSTGGRIDGMIHATDHILKLANDNTKIIPGHGDLSGLKELREYRHMLVTVRDNIAKMKQKGMSRDDVIAAKPTAEFDHEWGGGFLKPDQWVGIVFDSMKTK